MAITWGNTSGYFRLGVDIQVSGTKATIIVYGQSVGYGHDWSAPLSFTGSWSGSKQVSFYSGYGQTVTKELHRSSASFTGKRTYGASISYWNGSSSVSRSVTITPPATPKPPATPSLTSISRTSDSQHVVSWSHAGGATGFRIERRDWNSGAWSAWRTVGTPGGSARSYTDTSTKAGSAYQWRASAYNSVGSSAYSGPSTPIPTTPLALPVVYAKRRGSGVLVEWSGQVSSPGSAGWHVMRDVDGGASTQIASLGASEQSYLDENPNQVQKQSYRVRQWAYEPFSGEYLYGPWTPTGIVQLASKPGVPSVVWPEVEQVYGVGRVWIRWKHNPTDGADQTSAYIEIFKDGTRILYVTVDGQADRYLWTPPSPGRYLVRVRTKASHPDWSDFSANRMFTVADDPVVLIQAPGETITTNRVRVEWTTEQAQGFTQNAWRVTLLDGEDSQIGQWSGTGNTSSFLVPYELDNHASYTVQVEAEANTLWSSPARQAFNVEFVPPAVPHVGASWDDSTGGVVVYVEAGETTSEVEATDHVDVYRSVDGGITWELAFEGLEPGTAVTDFESLSKGDTLYRAVAVTAVGGTADASFLLQTDSDKMWIGAGPGYANTISIKYNPEASGGVEVERASLVFDGRTLPVPVVGVARSQSMKLSGWLLDDEGESLDALLDLIQGDFVTHLVRIPGRSVYGIITSADWEYKRGGAWLVNFAISETEREVQ